VAIHESAEMYLETIYELSKTGSSVRSIDVAEALNYSRPSVSRAVGLLKSSGYLEMDKDGFLLLTETGKALAGKIYERHTLLTRILIRMGVSEEVAAADACRLEHAISDESFRAIKEYTKDLI